MWKRTTAPMAASSGCCPSDYTLPPLHDWIPVFGPVLTRRSRLYIPAAGGTLTFRDDPDSPDGAQGQIAFYGLDNYRANPAMFNAGVIINTPLTSDRERRHLLRIPWVSGDVPGGLASGIARIAPDGTGTWISVTDAASDAGMTQVPTNSALTLSADFRTVYAAVRGDRGDTWLALDSQTLQPRARMRLQDPATGDDAVLSDNGTASPTIGLDNDVYFGVLESSFENHARGWLLHFDGELLLSKTPGAFGWDTTAVGRSTDNGALLRRGARRICS